MKQPFGVKLARSCLRSMRWIAANHRSESAVSVFAVWCVNKRRRSSAPELLEVLRGIYASQIETLGERLQRDLSSWLEWNGRRPLRAGGQILERTARQV